MHNGNAPLQHTEQRVDECRIVIISLLSTWSMDAGMFLGRKGTEYMSLQTQSRAVHSTRACSKLSTKNSIFRGTYDETGQLSMKPRWRYEGAAERLALFIDYDLG